MRNYIIYSFTLPLLMNLGGCNKENSPEAKKIIIAGQVTGFDKNSHEQAIQIVYYDIIEENPISKNY